ncbi:hypothetical protein DDP54_07785 [Cellulomonas sp. WB94]|nr:hypothetical protein DDP54_07785 [Cellulomonas sp. WB94]
MRLRIGDSHDPIDLDRATVVELFALGLQTREPDPSRRVAVGELDVADEIAFLVGTTTIDHGIAVQAVRRGVERSLDEAVALLRRQSPAAPGTSDPP